MRVSGDIKIDLKRLINTTEGFIQIREKVKEEMEKQEENYTQIVKFIKEYLNKKNKKNKFILIISWH